MVKFGLGASPASTATFAAHGVDDTPELDKNAVDGALDDAGVVHRDGRINEIAALRPEPRESAVFIRAREAAVAGHIRAIYRLLSTLHRCET